MDVMLGQSQDSYKGNWRLLRRECVDLIDDSKSNATVLQEADKKDHGNIKKCKHYTM